MPGYVFKEPSELKTIILFIVDSYGEAVTNGEITDIFMTHEFVDYFTMQQFLDELLKSGLLEIYTENGIRKYLLTEIGRDGVNGFKKNIPLTVRENILNTIKEYKKKLDVGNAVMAKYIKHNEIEHEASLLITEGGSPLLRISVNAGSAENARLMCSNFKNNPQEIYKKIFEILSQK